MRLAFERFQHSSPGYRATLRSSGVRSDLQRRAGAVAAVVDRQLAGLDAPYPTVIATSTIGRGRASATISGVPLPLEASRRILGGAIDAAS